jgi:cytochrome P450
MNRFFKSSLDAMMLSRDPVKFFNNKSKKYGELFPIYLPQSPETYLGGSANVARELFNVPPHFFSPSASNPISPIVGSHSLILLGGAKHKEEKRLINPFFHGVSLLENQKIIQGVIAEELDRLFKVDGDIYLLKNMQEITLHVIIATIFGVKDRNDRLELKLLISDYINSFTSVLMFLPQSRKDFAGVGPWRKFNKMKKQFDNYLIQLIKNTNDQVSIISKFKILYSEDIKKSEYTPIIDQLKTILIAGHETTAISLFWCLYYLTKNEDLYQKLKKLIQSNSLEALLADPFLHATCNEALRIYPSVPIILRSLVTDLDFMGKRLKAGENIGLSLTLLHHDKVTFKNSYDFNPQRFIDNEYEMCQFAPFGGSNRKCVGSSFAYLEMKLCLIELFLKSDFSSSDTCPIVPIIKGVTMCPARDLLIKLRSN